MARPYNINKYAEEEVFVLNSTYARQHLKARIRNQNLLPYICAICNIGPIWNEKPMPLILDHINGINNDNRIENLRFVCSNCDSQLDTYKSRNKGRLTRAASSTALKADGTATYGDRHSQSSANL